MTTALDLAILVSGSLRRFRKCRIFDAILDECWSPQSGREKQAEQIRAFARRHHWRVHLHAEGLRLIADFENKWNSSRESVTRS
jgi:hypothetical protein